MAYASDSHDIDLARRPNEPVRARFPARLRAALSSARRRVAAWSDQADEEAITRALLDRAGGELTDGLEREAERRWTASQRGVRYY